MNKHEIAFIEAEKRSRACADWIKALMRPGQSKPATKDELFEMAKAELDINRSNFDDGWILAIEEMGRQDWYKPNRRSAQKKQ